MSTFTAINVSEDESDIEEHTRELQIEYAFKVFERALKAQKLKDFEKAGNQYQELFKIDVVTAKNPTLHPTIENLKYLAFRNRGFFKLSSLLVDFDKGDVADDQQQKQLKDGKNSNNSENDNNKKDDDAMEIDDDEDSDEDEEEKEEIFERLTSAIDDLVSALKHGEGDFKIIQWWID
ncbi:unnamed protein product [Ambrosiozyma monospora]|uniref:Unnamed protein product n=1 Tax=Ambrosiozyma monospora TaxID=43982 RepID=A0ACB5TB53_AMBMO|nr:unnamed protein product [Ambrosiozyma monospora]